MVKTIAAVGLVVLIGSCAHGEFNTDKYIKLGDDYMKMFNNKKALEMYQIASNNNQTKGELLHRLSTTYIDYGEDLLEQNDPKTKEVFQLAVEYSKKLVKQYPNKSSSHFLIASAYGNLANFKEGGEKISISKKIEYHAKRAIELDPLDVKSHNVLGIYYRKVAQVDPFLKFLAHSMFGGFPNGTLADSIKFLQRSLELSPQNIRAHYEIAQTYIELRDLAAAKHHLQALEPLKVDDHEDKAIKKKGKNLLKKIGGTK